MAGLGFTLGEDKRVGSTCVSRFRGEQTAGACIGHSGHELLCAVLGVVVARSGASVVPGSMLACGSSHHRRRLRRAGAEKSEPEFELDGCLPCLDMWRGRADLIARVSR